MNTIHLSELDLQHYALHPLQAEHDIIDHVQTCEYCRSQIEVYKAVFMSAKDIPPPSLGFDPYKLVLPKIQATQAKGVFPTVPLILILAFAVTLISLIGILLIKKQVLGIWLHDINHSINHVLIAGGVLIVIFQVTDLLLRFTKQVKEFDKKQELQQNSGAVV